MAILPANNEGFAKHNVTFLSRLFIVYQPNYQTPVSYKKQNAVELLFTVKVVGSKKICKKFRKSNGNNNIMITAFSAIKSEDTEVLAMVNCVRTSTKKIE